MDEAIPTMNRSRACSPPGEPPSEARRPSASSIRSKISCIGVRYAPRSECTMTRRGDQVVDLADPGNAEVDGTADSLGARSALRQRRGPPPTREPPTRLAGTLFHQHHLGTRDLDGCGDGSRFLDGGLGRDRDATGVAHSGMFPCLRCGSSSRLDLSISRPAMTLMRVSAGSMTSSTKPRSAAAYGLAKRSV